MIYPVHHVPGRLRIKNPAIKGNARAAQAWCRRIKAIVGVNSVEVSPLTGSAVIGYCPESVTGLAILNQLDGQRYGAGQEVWVAPPPETPLADRFLGTMAQTLAERSAAALLAALL